MRNRNIVKQDYRLVNGKYNYTTNEIKFILIVVAQIDMNDKEFETYEIKVSDLEEKLQAKQNETRLKQFAKGLMKKPFDLPTDTGWVVINWFSMIEYIRGQAKFVVTIDKHLKPYLLELKKHFVKYDLRYILPLKSNYSIRIYQLLKEYENIGKREFNLKELQDILKVPTTYQSYRNFKQKVLTVTQRELKKHTDIYFTFDEIKTGRKVTEIIFHIKKNADNEYLKELETAKLLQETKIIEYSPELKEFINETHEHYKGKNEFLEVIHNDRGREYVVCINDKGQLYDGALKEVFTPQEAKEIWEKLYLVQNASKPTHSAINTL